MFLPFSWAIGAGELILIGVVLTIMLVVTAAMVWGGIALARRGNSKEDIRRQVEEEVRRRLEEERNSGPPRPPAS